MELASVLLLSLTGVLIFATYFKKDVSLDVHTFWGRGKLKITDPSKGTSKKRDYGLNTTYPKYTICSQCGAEIKITRLEVHKTSKCPQKSPKS
ncbi:MAG: hypothetical protein ACRCU2_19520 [Planktothrix sp.]